MERSDPVGLIAPAPLQTRLSLEALGRHRVRPYDVCISDLIKPNVESSRSVEAWRRAHFLPWLAAIRR